MTVADHETLRERAEMALKALPPSLQDDVTEYIDALAGLLQQAEQERKDAFRATGRMARRADAAEVRAVQSERGWNIALEDAHLISHQRDDALDRVRLLEAALRIYAKADNWMQDEHGSWLFDCPSTATPWDFARAAFDGQPAKAKP